MNYRSYYQKIRSRSWSSGCCCCSMNSDCSMSFDCLMSSAYSMSPDCSMSCCFLLAETNCC